MTSTTGIKLDEETRSRLKFLSEIRNRSTHWLMKEAILEYLDKEEEKEERNRQADEAWEHYQKTGLFVSHERVMAWLKSLGTDKELPCPEPEINH